MVYFYSAAYTLLSVDGKLLTYDEARRLLTDKVIHSDSGRFRAEVHKGPSKWTAGYFGPGEEDRGEHEYEGNEGGMRQGVENQLAELDKPLIFLHS